MIEYFILFPYSSLCLSILSMILIAIRLIPKLYKNNISKIISIIIFSIIDYLVLTFLFSFGIIFAILHCLLVIGLITFLLEKISVIGITGNICAGKSVLVDYLKTKYNSSIINIDDENRRVLQRKDVLDSIKKAFGNEVFIYDENSHSEVLNKKRMREIIYSDKKKKKQLEMITHPKVFMLFLKDLVALKFIENKKYVFIENAILLKVPMLKIFCKYIISVTVKDRNILIQRIMKRDNCNEEQANKILSVQTTYDEFVYNSHIILTNEGTEEEFKRKIDEVIKMLD